ncbi:MAG: chemotaxis protein CheD [Phycisphaerae bacterium]|nr:chemotaxis protein CheD [Phycisphaerae bacterium]MCZ2399538.1 chemotaxis protein CheD [Phycisphaerae bacterium]
MADRQGPGAISVNLLVDIADVVVSADPRHSLVTGPLGSCLAVAAWEPQARVGGMLHFALPDSSLDETRREVAPAMFCDSGLRALLAQMAERGAVCERLEVRVAGASRLLSDEPSFELGKRNYLALRKQLKLLGIPLCAEHVGDSIRRALRLSIGDGQVTLITRTGETRL